jgi:molecular chaperone DnaK (HSP70)
MKASSLGNNQLGGEDFDKLLLIHYASYIKKTFGVDVLHPKNARIYVELLERFCVAKEELSEHNKVFFCPLFLMASDLANSYFQSVVHVPDFMGNLPDRPADAPKDLVIEITREEYESVIASQVALVVGLVDECLESVCFSRVAVVTCDLTISSSCIARIIMPRNGSLHPLLFCTLVGHQGLLQFPGL